MSVQTKTVWEDTVLNEELKQITGAKVATLMEQGKTDGIRLRTDNDPTAGQVTILRTWVDQPAAEEWITFINSLEADPVSIAILP
jgi:hypothetical protein